MQVSIDEKENNNCNTSISITLYNFYKHKIIIDKFNVKTIIIENTFLINDIELKKLLSPVYNKSLFNLKN